MSGDSVAVPRPAAVNPVEAPPPGPGGDIRGLGRGSLANLIGALASGLATFGLTLVVTRGISKADAGVFFSATSLIVLATSVGQLGTSTGIVYFVSKARSLGRIGDVPAYLRTALRPVVVVATFMSVVLLFGADQIGEVITPGHGGQSASMLRLLALFIVPTGVGTLYLSASRGMGTMRPTVVLDQFVRSIGQVLLVGLAIWAGRSGLISLGWSVPYLVLCLGALLWWRVVSRPASSASTEASRRAADKASRRAANREFWRFTAPRALAAVAQVVMQRLDIILVGGFLGPVQAAIYAASTRFFVVGQLINRALWTAVEPRLGRSLATHDLIQSRSLYRTSTAWLMMLIWPAMLTFVTYRDTVLTIFGTGYSDGRVVLTLLSLAWLFSSAVGMVDVVLTMAGRTSWNLWNTVLAVGVNIVLDIVLIPRLGIVGAAVGWTVAIVLSNALAFGQVAHYLRLHPFGAGAAVIAILAPLCFTVLPFVLRGHLPSSAGLDVGVLTVSVLTYAVGLLVMRRHLHLRELVTIRRRRRGALTGGGDPL